MLEIVVIDSVQWYGSHEIVIDKQLIIIMYILLTNIEKITLELAINNFTLYQALLD